MKYRVRGIWILEHADDCQHEWSGKKRWSKNIRCRGAFFPRLENVSLPFFPCNFRQGLLELVAASSFGIVDSQVSSLCVGFLSACGLGSRFDSLTQRFVPV